MTQRRTFVRSPRELEKCWRELIEPLGFGSRQIFAVLIDREGEVFRHLIHITECPYLPDAEMVANLAAALRSARDEADPEGSCAVFWARPTHEGTRQSDLLWARSLYDAFRKHSLDRWPIHVADDSVMRVVAPEDLAA